MEEEEVAPVALSDRLAGGKLLIFKRVGESSDRDGISMGTRALR